MGIFGDYPVPPSGNTNFVPGAVIQSLENDGNFDALADHLNSTFVDDAIIDDGAINGSKLTTNSVVALQLSRKTDPGLAAVATANIQPLAVTAAELAVGAVTSAKILDGTIVDADISAVAAIAGTKINFTNSITTGDIVNGTIIDADVSLKTTTPGTTGISGNKIQDGTIPLAALGFPLAGGPGNVPVGAGMDWYTDIAPPQWVLCDGQTLSKVTYAALFSLWGGSFNTGGEVAGPAGTFRTPDLRGRIGINKGTDPNIDAVGKNDGLVGYDAFGAVGALEIANLLARTMSHDHDWDLVSHTHSVFAHSHTIPSLAVPSTGLILTGSAITGQVTAGLTKWRISDGAGSDTSTPTISVNTGGPSTNVTGTAAPAGHDHSMQNHTHGLGGHRHNVLVVTGTIGGPVITGPNPDTPTTTHTHPVDFSGMVVAGNAASTASSTGSGLTPASAGTSGTPSFTLTQTTDPSYGAFFVKNHIVYTGV